MYMIIVSSCKLTCSVSVYISNLHVFKLCVSARLHRCLNHLTILSMLKL